MSRAEKITLEKRSFVKRAFEKTLSLFLTFRENKKKCAFFVEFIYIKARLSLSLTRWMASLSLSLSRVLCAKCCAYFCASRLSRVSFVKEARAVCSFVFLFFFEEEVLRRISKQTLCPVERERERERRAMEKRAKEAKKSKKISSIKQKLVWEKR